MELPCPVPMILSIKLPCALLQVVLEQSDIDIPPSASMFREQHGLSIRYPPATASTFGRT